MLQVLLGLQLQNRQQALSAYGDWYRELASCGSPWQDHLLDEVRSSSDIFLAWTSAVHAWVSPDPRAPVEPSAVVQIMAGRNNPLARAAALGDAAAEAAHLHAAAAQDLDALQRLSVTESTLAGGCMCAEAMHACCDPPFLHAASR